MAFTNIIDIIYPVGSFYISTSSTSPATLFGGTWAALSARRFICAAGTNYSAGTTGGEETHILTQDEMPSHVHANPCATEYGGNASYYRSLFATNSPFWTHTDWNNQTASAGADAAHENRPPYIAEYIWYRTK